MEYWWVAMPAAISLVIKTYLLVKCGRSSDATLHYTTLLQVCLLQSLCEVVTFVSYMLDAKVDGLFRVYYLSIMAWSTAAFYYVAQITQKPHIATISTAAVFTASLSLAFLIMGSQLIVAGYINIGHSITAIKGPLYALYQIFIFFVTLLPVIILLVKVQMAKSTACQNKMFCLLCAFSAPMLTVIGVTVAMQAGVKVNMAMVFPAATTIFALILVASEQHHNLTSFKRHIPHTDENEFAAKVNNIANLVLSDKIKLKDAQLMFEYELIQFKKSQCNGNIVKTANALGIPKSTLYSKLDRLGSIDLIKTKNK